MAINNLRSSSLLPVKPAPAFTGFTATTTTVVPANCTQARVFAIGGGCGGSYGNGGNGATGAITEVGVAPGETLTITIGAGGAAGGGAGGSTTVVGTFGTITAAGSSVAGQTGRGADGTYFAGFGWYGGSGGNNTNGGAGRPGGGNGQAVFGSGQAAMVNSGGGGGGAGGGPSAGLGGSGFVGIFFR